MKNLVYILIIIGIVLIVLLIPIEVPTFKGNETHEIRQPNLTPTYPEYPKLEDCERTEKRDFCLSDVAEINSDLAPCNMIGDPDIKIFCVARVLLNETMCEDIKEEGLRGACLESIGMKKEWLGIK